MTEASLILGIPVGTVKTRVMCAKSEFRSRPSMTPLDRRHRVLTDLATVLTP